MSKSFGYCRGSDNWSFNSFIRRNSECKKCSRSAANKSIMSGLFRTVSYFRKICTISRGSSKCLDNFDFNISEIFSLIGSKIFVYFCTARCHFFAPIELTSNRFISMTKKETGKIYLRNSNANLFVFSHLEMAQKSVDDFCQFDWFHWTD